MLVFKMKDPFKLLLVVFASLLSFVAFFNVVFASDTDGTIDSTDHFAWGENIGWINFLPDNGNVKVTDTGLFGYAFGENVGWIDLENIMNDGNGKLSGMAWGENIGWIKFDPDNGGVVINSSGEFTGSALSENVGWIIFDGDKKVKTDWRPRISRAACNNAIDDDGDGLIDYPNDRGCSSLTDNDETDPAGGGAVLILNATQHPISTTNASVTDKVISAVEALIPDFVGRKKEAVSTVKPSQEESLSLSNPWDYLDTSFVNNFILAPLPSQLAVFVKKYPDLGKIFTKLGVNKITDMEKLNGTVIDLPTIADLKNLPQEVVIAKAGMGKIDVVSSITLDETGKAGQKIQTTSNTSLTLAVKPNGPVDSVDGYLVFKQNATKTVAELPLNLQFASVVLASQGFVTTTPQIPDREMLVQSFNYEDSNNDGIYTADIKTPSSSGTYEVITLINYKDKSSGTRELRLETVIDPEGYVYYLNSNGDESRVSGAVISIFNADTKTLWDAPSYNQINPQLTDSSGKYSFLMPEGNYYMTVEKNGYHPYKSDILKVKSGVGVHFNIELQGSGWLAKLDWKIASLLLVILLIISVFAGYAIHEHVFKKKLMDRS